MSTPPPKLGQLIRHRRVIVCCGAGGVGKTTTAAALALAGARAGRRVLVLTIDPSKRLAETLGVSRNPPTPVALPPDRLAAAGITAPGSLDAWMLDPKLIADESVRRLTKTKEDAERVLNNRIYQQISAMVAGMHEYTAMEALHRFVTEGRYDLVVLDTPPSRHALDFLEAPRRLSALIEGRALAAFLPKGDSIVTRAASKLVEKILAAIFGGEFAQEFVAFLVTFTTIFQSLTLDVRTMREFLSGDDVAFLLVASPAPAMLAEAFFFHDKTRELGLPFRGFVLNRSQARGGSLPFPDTAWLGEAPDAARAALPKLQALAELERQQAARDLDLVRQLQQKAGPHGAVLALPELPQGADDMGTLLAIAQTLAND